MLHDFMREKSEDKNSFFKDPPPHVDNKNLSEINDNDDDEIKVVNKEKRMSMTSTLEGIYVYIYI
jgi:hypothetical protein